MIEKLDQVVEDIAGLNSKLSSGPIKSLARAPMR